LAVIAEQTGLAMRLGHAKHEMRVKLEDIQEQMAKNTLQPAKKPKVVDGGTPFVAPTAYMYDRAFLDGLHAAGLGMRNNASQS
jgi:hypothetical protein